MLPKCFKYLGSNLCTTYPSLFKCPNTFVRKKSS